MLFSGALPLAIALMVFSSSAIVGSVSSSPRTGRVGTWENVDSLLRYGIFFLAVQF